MARPFGREPGGIRGLDGLIEDYPKAIEADLIDRGLRLRHLGTEALTWGDLAAVMETLYVRPESALYRLLIPDWMWGLDQHLQADQADSLRFLVWAKTKDAQKGINRPPLIQRPGVKGPEKVGDQPMSIAEMNNFLDWGAA